MKHPPFVPRSSAAPNSSSFGSVARSVRCLLGVVALLPVIACSPTEADSPASAGPDATATNTETGTGETTFKGEVWGDNWSSMYVGEKLVMEDSVSITTERSFNQETFAFKAQRPFLVNVIMKDFIENDSGLEYIGKPNQQMGDGGYIAQITDTATNQVAAVSNSTWKCLTIHEAPLNTECESASDPVSTCKASISQAPGDWKTEAFDDSAWVNATEWSASDVGPKDGYNEISWDASARLIWGSNLKTHNTILCRTWVK